MSGIWNTRSPYSRIFAGWTPAKEVAARTPPPISPFVPAQDDLYQEEDLLEPVSAPIDENEFFEQCAQAYAAALQTYKKRNVNAKRTKDVFGTVVSAINLSGEVPFSSNAPVLDMTGSVIFPMLLRKLGHTNPITIHGPAHKLSGAERKIVEQELTAANFGSDELTPDFVGRFARIFVDRQFVADDDVIALLKAFTQSESSGSIFITVMINVARKLSKEFDRLSFEQCVIKGTKDSSRFSAHSHVFLIRITHAHGLRPLPFDRSLDKRKRYIPSVREEEITPAPREPSPLTCDFTFEDMSKALLEAATAPLQVVHLTPSQATAFVPSEVLFPFPPPDPVCASPVLVETNNDEEELVFVPPVLNEDPLPVEAEPVVEETHMRDEVERETVIDYAAIEEKLASKNTKKILKAIRDKVPDNGAPEFGGTCPLINDAAVAVMAKLVCDWMNEHPNARGFFDIRSRGAMAASLYKLLPADQIKIGHLIYSRDYHDALLGLYLSFRRPSGSSGVCSTRCPYGEIHAPLFGLEAKYFADYQMLFMLAVYLDKNNFDLLHALNAFRLSSSAQVMWVCMTKPQYEYVSTEYTAVKYRMVTPKFLSGKITAALYEVTK